MTDAVDVVLRAFRAVQDRDREALLALYDPEVEFVWPGSLPYGGSSRSAGAAHSEGRSTWTGTWDPLQPTATERRMDPRVVAAAGDEVVVLYRQRAVDAAGRRMDEQVLGLYAVRDGRLARAQMFHFDTAAVASFLAGAEACTPPSE